MMEIKLHCKSRQERLARVRDNLKRGFMPVKFFQFEKEGNCWIDSGFRDRDGAKYRYGGNSSYMVYGVIMRKKEEVKGDGQIE